MHVDIASVTSKGQFTIPQRFCEKLELTAGSKMVVMCDGKHLLMRPIEPDAVVTFRTLVDESKKLHARGKRLAAKKRKGGSK
jgi:bifunctional DNA-binding transcriptional regulator/antitoxin component of YhaV-PrlF toxin-antitoxin module